MSYGKAYTITVASKNETASIIYTVEIWERDFAGYEAAFDAANSPLTGQVLSNSDDPTEVIIASTITLLIDTTDFTGTLPDFITFDNRKYWVKVYANNPTYYMWQGFMLNQGVSYPFITGRVFLQIVCVDGLAILSDIPYVPSVSDINIVEDLSTTITNCLNQIQLPDGYNINYLAQIYNSGMNTNISVFKQCYLATRNYLNSDLTYKSCYEILEMIAQAFCCQVYQSNGEWWVANLNDRSVDYIDFFQTTNANGVETKTNRGKMREIKPYVDVSTTPWYFQEASQTKLARMGYPTLEFIHNIGFSAQSIDNGTMDTLSGSFPANWSKSLTGSVTGTSLGPHNAILMAVTGGGPTQTPARAFPISVSGVYIGNVINLTFWIDGNVPPSSTIPKCKVSIIIQGPAPGFDSYSLNSDNDWEHNTTALYSVFGRTSGAYESISITTPIAPISGQVIIQFETVFFDTLDCTIANVVMNFSSSAYSYQKITSKVYIGSNYKKTTEIFIGAQSNNDVSGNGTLLDASGAALISWFRSGVTEGYNSLMRLIAQQYTNVLCKAQINFSMTARGLYDNRFEVGPVLKRRDHIIGLADVATVQDSTTNSLSVDGKYYITGAMDINYTEDAMTGTLLETSNVDLTSIFTDELITNQ